MSEPFLLKDALFNATKVGKIAGEIAGAYPGFKRRAFEHEVLARFPELELKERIGWIAECLKKYLPAAYPDALNVLLSALPPPCDPALSDDDFGDFIYAPYSEFVVRNGCTRARLARSLNALKAITTRFSAEDAIRAFINAFPAETLTTLQTWCEHEHYHVRRLCSEGTRPSLPWSARLSMPSEAALPLLEVLHADNTRFVTRSVANHLNDISKQQPELVIHTLERWRELRRQRQDELAFITRHAMRTLVKRGHPQALALLGVSASAEVSVSDLTLPHHVAINSALAFSFVLNSAEPCEALVDYILHFTAKSGAMRSKKVFKLKQVALAAGKPVMLSKRHPLRGGMTTRTLYPGPHALEIQVNGSVRARAQFVLTA